MSTITPQLLREAATELQQTAARLYPDNAALQAEWVRAVGVVRKTARGWLLDVPATKQERRYA